jgi:hypothetical protein
MKTTDERAKLFHQRCTPLVTVVALAFFIACCSVAAGGGSIFDDDWVPPKPAVSHKSPAQPPPAVPSPAPNPAAPTPAADPKTADPKTAVPPAPQPAGRRAIPTRAEQARSRALLKTTFADRLKDRSIAGRKKLALALLEEVPNVTDNASDEYVLLGGAIDASKEAGILSLCAKAADVMSSQYEVDAPSIKIDSALKMDLRGDSPASSAENVQIVLQLVESLLPDENFATAAKLLIAARRAAQHELASRVQKQLQIVEFLRLAHDRAAPSVEKLAASPEDPAANLAVGSYLCFIRGQWEKGLPMLARGTDPGLKRLALSELSHPEGDGLVALADGWWDAAASQPEMSRNVIRQHAAACYKLALPAASGLVRLRLERRIAEVPVPDSASAQASPSAAATAAGPAKPPGAAKPPGPEKPSGEKSGAAGKGVEFLADRSASLRPAGTQERSKTRQFAKQQSDDPLDPFSGRTIYFGLSSHDIWYAITAPAAISQVYWRGASFKNLTIEAVDDSGTTLRKIGPVSSGDDAYEFTLDMPPTRHFLLHFHTENRHWIMFEAIELRAHARPDVNGPTHGAK